MEIEKEKMVSLNDDDKAVSLKTLSDLFFAVRQLHEWIKENTLTEKMKDTIFSLIESYTADVSTILGYDSEARKRLDERFSDIRKTNATVRELQNKLAANTPVEGVKELLCAMQRALYDWWTDIGFNLVTDESFGFWGYKGRFCLDIRHISFSSRRPVTDEKKHKNQLEQMIDDGYEFIMEDQEYVLVDTPGNRQKITEIVKAKFPSLDISKWENWRLHKREGFQLRSFEGYIRDLNEMKALMDELRGSD